MKNLYLYLNEESHCESWINGGRIPLKLASSYRQSGAGGHGVMTENENLISNAKGIPLSLFHGPNAVFSFPIADGPVGAGMRRSIVAARAGLTISNEIDQYTSTGPKEINFDAEEAVIFCATTDYSSKILQKFNKLSNQKKACVKLRSLDPILKAGDVALSELGVLGKIGRVRYVKTAERGHFIKGDTDRWQREWRVVWPGVQHSIEIDLPAGVAQRVKLPAI